MSDCSTRQSVVQRVYPKVVLQGLDSVVCGRLRRSIAETGLPLKLLDDPSDLECDADYVVLCSNTEVATNTEGPVLVVGDGRNADVATCDCVAPVIAYLAVAAVERERLRRTLDDCRDDLEQTKDELEIRIVQRTMDLVYRAEFERIISDMSTQFISLKTTEIDSHIERAIEQISGFVGVDMGFILQRQAEDSVAITHLWHSQLVDVGKEDFGQLPAGVVPEWIAVGFEHREEESWVGEQFGHDVFTDQLIVDPGLQSLLVVPLIHETEPIGLLGLASMQLNREWTEDERTFSRFVGQVFTNTLHRKEMDEVLQEAKEKAEVASKAKSEFLANITHEIRTPLNAVIGFSDLLVNLLEDEDQRGYVESIRMAGQNLLIMINDILDLSKIEAGRMNIRVTPMRISTLLDEVQRIFQVRVQEKGLELITELDEDVPELLLLDEIRVRQVLLNLVGNALKFTDDGQIRVMVVAEKCGEDVVDLEIAVEDTGIGIPEEDFAAIFESFRQQSMHNTKKYGGTGLGLAITKSLVEMMAGEVSVRSVLHEGSCFVVRLPSVGIPTTDAAPPSDLRQRTDVCFEASRVLVVDDVRSNRRLLGKVLGDANLIVECAASGEEALAALDAFMPGLIVLDLRMPSMDGFETFARIRERERFTRIPVIALCDPGDTEYRARASSAGFAGVLGKPVQVRLLTRQLRKHLPHCVITESQKAERRARSETVTLDKEELRARHELVEALKERIAPGLAKLAGGMKMTDAKDIGEQVCGIAAEYDHKRLNEWGEQLQASAEKMQIKRIDNALTWLTDFLNGD